jgi:hypothetical protein
VRLASRIAVGPTWTGHPRRRAELDVMSIRVDHKDLIRPIRASPPRNKVRLGGRQMLLPSIEVVHQQGKVVAAIVGYNLPRPLTDEVQLLVGPQAKPCPGKCKRRPWNHLQAQDVPIKCDRPGHIGHVKRDWLSWAIFIELARDPTGSEFASRSATPKPCYHELLPMRYADGLPDHLVAGAFLENHHASWRCDIASPVWGADGRCC